MGKKNRRADRTSMRESEELVNNPFGALGGLDLPPAPEKKPEPATGAAFSFKGAVLRVRIEKKGRGGKTVTVIQGFPEDRDDAIQPLAKDLRKTLGTGGSFFEDTLELQGDCRCKAAEFLRAKGFTVRGV